MKPLLPSKPNILLVDDRPENLLALNAVLRSPDYNLVEVESGEAALKELMDRDFALILMDVQMPGLSGFETAMLIKKRNKSEFVPLMFITASFVDEYSALEGYKIGAVDYIIKPFNPETLKAKVQFFAEYYKNNQKGQQQLELEKEFHKIIEVVSHDLKNPLGFMKLSMQVLNRHMENQNHKAVLEALENKLPTMLKAAEQMQNLIEGILDLAKIEGSEIVLDKKWVNVNSIISEVIEMLMYNADLKNVTIENNLNDNCCLVECDPERIRQVFSNIIGNAVKFIPEKGTISICSTLKNGGIIFQITDTGPGIPTEDLSHLFDRFWQASNGTKHGTGLGLSISKWIVEAHGGKIWVESAYDIGSSFYFELPQAQLLGLDNVSRQ